MSGTKPWRRLLGLSFPGLDGTIVPVLTAAPSFPMEPLWRQAILRWGADPAADIIGGRPVFTMKDFAAMVETSDRTAYIWRAEGIPMFAADAAATALGLDPRQLWPMWSTVCEALWHERWDEPEVEQLELEAVA